MKTIATLVAKNRMPSGGKREGSGRKPKFKDEEETTTIAFRVPVTKKDEIVAKIEKILSKYAAKKKKA